jgi:peroxiredoxin
MIDTSTILPTYAELGAYVQQNFPPDLLAKQAQSQRELRESDILDYCLKTGDQIPRFSLYNAYGKLVNIQDLLNSKPWLVITFYRGAWCPFCNLTLKYLQKSLAEIESSPANLVAISPQTPDNSLETMQKNELNFEILSDLGSQVGKMFKVVYTVPDYLTDVFARNGVDFQYVNGVGRIELPVSATYIVDSQGVIRNHHVDTSPIERLDPQTIVNFIRSN